MGGLSRLLRCFGINGDKKKHPLVAKAIETHLPHRDVYNGRNSRSSGINDGGVVIPGAAVAATAINSGGWGGVGCGGGVCGGS
ncbi:Hypothetical predicted protein [Olea europaea subsp. europaea]|uniref:Uncharacterized protein n=1 Tax=Olea europaea subsp. europaea TaxID=158383 RepID=A0A8S0UWT0_OLEEU|nr:Hypothetical predicted protein [Olea europaea subsp. europaea]